MGFNCRPLEHGRSRLDHQLLVSLLLYREQRYLQLGIGGILFRLGYYPLSVFVLIGFGIPSYGISLLGDLQVTHLASGCKFPRLAAIH